MCRSLDAALVSPGEPTAFPNERKPPALTKGMAFNLANNLWGTNYVMWQPYEDGQDHMRFRFLLQMTDVKALKQQQAASREVDMSHNQS